MGRQKEFLSDEELSELRKEIEALAAPDGRENADPKAGGEENSEEASHEQKLTEIIREVEAEPQSMEDNGSYVHIGEDNMCAWLCLTVPENPEDTYTMEELIAFLQKNKVTAGYHHSNLAAMIKKKVYEREIMVAEGKPALEGTDGYFEYKFDPDQYRMPKVLENGKVDYTSMSTLQNVRKGDVVAVYHHACEGQDGYDVSGKTLTAKRVKEIPPLRGQAVSNEDNPDVYVATRDGKIEFKNGRIDIQTMHEINGDVTLITGKVEFFGDVTINGNVESGVVIRAGRNIEIKGTVEAVNLFAGGDIVLSRGIQGNQKAKVSARGNIFADFIEHTVVVAGGNVQANTILNSRIQVDGNVILTGKKGAIIGGYTHALLGIAATELGNQAEVRTVVHAGCEKEIYQKLQNAKVRGTELAQRLQELNDELATLRKRKSRNPDGLSLIAVSHMKELENELRQVRSDLEENKSERVVLENEIRKGAKASVVVNGNIYRGTVVSLAQMQMPIEHNTCYMKYTHQRGMIESGVIAYS